MTTEDTSQTPDRETTNWVKFQRFACMSGWIDRWMGDSANNPNNEKQSQLNLNTFVTYYRLNDGTWFHSSHFVRNAISEINAFKDCATAEEIFTSITEPTPHPEHELTEEDRKRFSTWFINYVRNVNPVVGIDDTFAVFEYATKYERSKQTAELDKLRQRYDALDQYRREEENKHLAKVLEYLKEIKIWEEECHKLREALEAIANTDASLFGAMEAIKLAKSALQ